MRAAEQVSPVLSQPPTARRDAQFNSSSRPALAAHLYKPVVRRTDDGYAAGEMAVYGKTVRVVVKKPESSSQTSGEACEHVPHSATTVSTAVPGQSVLT